MKTQSSKKSGITYTIIVYPILIFVALFILFSAFPKLWNNSGRIIRNLKHTATATIDSVKITHENWSIVPKTEFYYHYTPNNTDTVIFASTTVKHQSRFLYSADKLKQRYNIGSQIPVYYKLKKSGRYADNIYPQNEFFHLGSFLFADLVLCLGILFIICSIITVILFHKNGVWAAIKAGFFVAGAVFLVLWFIFTASPKIQQTVFEKTHPQFVKVETSVHDWSVKRKRGGRRSSGYNYVTAKFDYQYNGKQYQSIIAPVKVRALFNRYKIAKKEQDRLQANHNNVAYIDKYNPEYAVLFVSKRAVFLYSTYLFDMFGALIIAIGFIIIAVVVSAKLKNKAPKLLKKSRYTLFDFFKLWAILMFIIIILIVVGLFIVDKLK